jgi:hypothetical protein
MKSAKKRIKKREGGLVKLRVLTVYEEGGSCLSHKPPVVIRLVVSADSNKKSRVCRFVFTKAAEHEWSEEITLDEPRDVLMTKMWNSPQISNPQTPVKLPFAQFGGSSARAGGTVFVRLTGSVSRLFTIGFDDFVSALVNAVASGIPRMRNPSIIAITTFFIFLPLDSDCINDIIY